MADDARDSMFVDPDRAMLWVWSASGHVPSYSGERCAALGYRGSDHTFITVDDVSSLLGL